VLEFDLDGKAAGYEQVLDEMQQTGYAGTELGDWGFMPSDPQRLRAALDARGLSLLSAFVPVLLKDSHAHAAGIESAVRTARLLAAVQGTAPFIVLADDNGKDAQRTRCAGRITGEMGLSEAEWQSAARGAEAVARAVLEETGLRTVLHHHCAGYVETPAEIDELLKRTDASLLGLCLDTGHYRYGGGQPLEGLRQHAARIWHVHFKDCHPAVAASAREQDMDYFAAVCAGIFCELGQGEIDFAAIKAELDKLGYAGWIVVEQDVLPGMGTPKASAQRNRDFLKTLGL
jgi:inosose dehydratase